MQFLTKPRRVELLDEIRGGDLLLMILYHGTYDLVYLFGVDIPLFYGPVGNGVQKLICCTFIVLAGISSRFSRSNLKRGLQTLGCGLLISLGTWFAMPELMIWFGILHFLGVSMLLFPLLRPLLDKLPPFAGIAVCLALFGITWGVPSGVIGVPGALSIALPPALYDNPWLLPLGFGGMGADYFPLLPWFFLFLAGTYLGVPFAQGDAPEFFYRPHSRFLSTLGRKSLLIYMLHQPVLYGVLWVVFRLAGAVMG